MTRLPRSGNERRLVAIALIDAAGSGMYLGGYAAFFTRATELTPRQIGVGISAGAALGLLSILPLSALGDRIGHQRMLIVLNFWRAVAVAGYVFVRTFPEFLLVICFVGLAGAAVSPVTQALVGSAVPDERRVAAMAWMRAVRNAGYGAGGLLAALLLLAASRAALDSIMVTDAVSFVVAGLLVSGLRAPAVAGRRVLGEWRRIGAVLGDRRYLAVTALNGVLMLQLSLLTVAMPLWLLRDTAAPRPLTGILLTVNTVLVVLLQVLAGRKASSVRAAGRLMMLAGLWFAASCVITGAASVPRSAGLAAALLVAAVTLQSLGEVQQSAAGWRLSFDLAPERGQGAYLGVFGSGAVAQEIAGPLIFTSVVLPARMTGWLAAAALFGLAGALLWRVTGPGAGSAPVGGAGQSGRAVIHQEGEKNAGYP